MDESFWRRIFSGRWNPGRRSGKNTIHRCNARNRSNVVDVEPDGRKIDIIVIDSPRCPSERCRQSSSSSLKCNKKCFPRRVIVIDEENNDYFGFGNANQSTNDRNNYHSSSAASYCPVDSDSDSDHDCEIMDDPTGNIREEWEKAYLMKRKRRDHTDLSEEPRVHCETSCEIANLEKNKNSCFDVNTSTNSKDVTSTSSSSDPNANTDENCDVIKEDAHDGMLHDCMNEENGQSNHRVLFPQMPNVQIDAIADWSKHKESEEYRLAQEEEWAARRQQIKIQQEEAQKLRKRKKAQTLRLLDMERRQKQRVEEIRESQKRNEETIDLKDNLRAMIRKELEFLELRHRDSASLLRALGINVRGGSYPLSSEVNAAFKHALFRFHPDRASKTDIREQVEAEEKFKLVSRLKQKLLPIA